MRPESRWNISNTMTGNNKELANAKAQLTTEIVGAAATGPVNIQGLVFPIWRAQMQSWLGRV